MSRPTRALIVTAISDKHKDQDPETQALILRDQCQRRGLIVVHVLELKMSRYNEKSLERAQRQVLDAIREYQADVLCVWALDRISRGGMLSTLRLLDLIEGHLACSIYSYMEPEISTATASPETRQLMIGLRAWLANVESRRRADRVKAKAESKRIRSASLGRRARWGIGHLVSDDDRERLAEFQRQNPGASLRAAARTLGIPWTTARRMRGVGQSSPLRRGGAPSETGPAGPKVPLAHPGGDRDG